MRVPAAPAWPYLAATAVGAVILTLGDLHRFHDGDSLIPVIMDSQRWTPYFWRDNRLGMLIPLVTWPIRNPMWNLLGQVFLNSWCWLLAPGLIARYLAGGRSWHLVGAVTTAALMVAVTPKILFYGLNPGQPYGVSLTLGLVGLMLLHRATRRSTWGGMALLLLACWTNYTVPVVLGPLLVFRWLARLETGSIVRPVAGLILSGVVAMGVRLLAAWSEPDTYFMWDLGVVGATRSIEAFQILLHRMGGVLHPGWAAGIAAFLVVLGAWRRSPGWRAALACLGAAGVVLLGLTFSKWVASNGFAARYTLQVMLLVQTGLALLLVGTTPASRRGNLLTGGVAVVLLVLAPVWAFGGPSLAGVQERLRAIQPRLVAGAIATRATHVAGPHNTVWPAVFAITWRRYEAGEGQPVWGLSARTQPTHRLWQDRPPGEVRIAIPSGESARPEVTRWLRRYDLLPVEVVEKRPGMWLMRPRAAP